MGIKRGIFVVTYCQQIQLFYYGKQIKAQELSCCGVSGKESATVRILFKNKLFVSDPGGDDDDPGPDSDNGSEDSWGNDGWDDGAASEQENS